MRRFLISILLVLIVTAGDGFAAGSPAKFEDSMAQRTLACAGCHGPQGRAGPDGYYPRIAGKPAGYLYNQLLNLRDGRRHYAPMTKLLEPLSDAYLLEIAQYFSKLDVPYTPPAALPANLAANSDSLKRGQTLALRGDEALKIPACVACHGKALTGVAPNVPGLLGLPRDYLNAQLGGWQTGQRRAHAPDCMAEVAKRLSGPDVSAVAAWLAVQPMPANPQPALASPGRPAVIHTGVDTIACGPITTQSARANPGTGMGTGMGTTEPADAPLANGDIMRGAYLARAGNCLGCHTQRGGAPYAGGRGIDTPFGTVYSSNLTPDAATGLGRWDRNDFWGALHHGTSKDGRRLYPAFPYTNYTKVTRADSDALFAFFRSLPAVAAINRPHALRWPYRTQAALIAWRALYFSPGEFTADAGKSVAWNRGAYLVQGLGHCNACHANRNALGAVGSPTDLAGGQIPLQNWYAPSLTSAKEAGLGDWDLPQIMALLKTGSTLNGAVMGPMADVVLGSTQHLTDADLQAMAVFLKDLATGGTPAPESVKPVATAPSAKKAELGAKIYEKHCANCHGEQGQGVSLGQRAVYPPLAGNRKVLLGQSVNLVQAVIHGGFAPATPGNPRPFGMPPFRLLLSDSEIAAVVTHIRTSWGNQGVPVSDLDVSLLRSAR